MTPDQNALAHQLADKAEANFFIGIRFEAERHRLSIGVMELADLCSVTRQQIARVERGKNAPGGLVLARFAGAGADINYILTGEHRISPIAVQTLLGKTAAHLPPEQLLGVMLCLANASADYSADLNPYPPKSPHHTGVETGWRMARAAITGDVAELPGVL